MKKLTDDEYSKLGSERRVVYLERREMYLEATSMGWKTVLNGALSLIHDLRSEIEEADAEVRGKLIDVSKALVLTQRLVDEQGEATLGNPGWQPDAECPKCKTPAEECPCPCGCPACVAGRERLN